MAGYSCSSWILIFFSEFISKGVVDAQSDGLWVACHSGMAHPNAQATYTGGQVLTRFQTWSHTSRLAGWELLSTLTTTTVLSCFHPLLSRGLWSRPLYVDVAQMVIKGTFASPTGSGEVPGGRGAEG